MSGVRDDGMVSIGGDVMKAKHWNVDIFIGESDDDTETRARAVLNAGGSVTVTGYGQARRNPIDRPVPEIGDELAACRALTDLADRLRAVAGEDIARMAGPARPSS
ncbi:UNVERIFIED_ORG: uncharacterized protein DUF1876 [Actinomadura viridilutea]